MNISEIGNVLKLIFNGAFAPDAALGGVIGVLIQGSHPPSCSPSNAYALLHNPLYRSSTFPSVRKHHHFYREGGSELHLRHVMLQRENQIN